MAEEQKHWRIAFPNNHFYHIISSTNINANNSILQKLNSSKCKLFEKTAEGQIIPLNRIEQVQEPNGLATIFGFPTDKKVPFLHVYVSKGRSIDAMKKMIELLDYENFPQKHIEPIAIL